MKEDITCINCHHISYDKSCEKHICLLWTSNNKDKCIVAWPQSQTCGTEDNGPGTGKFLSNKSVMRSKKLEQLGI